MRARSRSCRTGKLLYENRAATNFSHLRDFRTRSSPEKICRRPAAFNYATSPAFLRVRNAPRFFIVFKPLAETVMVIFLPSSGMKRVLVWRLTCRRRLPVGLNLVARVLLEYPPPTWECLPVIAHIRAIRRCTLTRTLAKVKIKE